MQVRAAERYRQAGITTYSLDRSGERFFHVSGPWWSIMVGYIIALSTMSVGGRYFAMFLMAGGYAGRWLVTLISTG